MSEQPRDPPPSPQHPEPPANLHSADSRTPERNVVRAAEPAAPDAPGTRTRRQRPESKLEQRLPPQDLDAERALLGSMMLDRDAIGLVVQIIPREESQRFYLPAHSTLFELLIDVYDRGEPMDLVIVRNELNARAILDQIGGVDYLVEILESIPSAVHCEHYARLVRDASLRRDVIACAGVISEMAYDVGAPAQEMLDQAEQALFDVTQKRIRNPAVAVSELLDEVYNLLERPSGSHLTGVPSGFLELDDLTSGFQKGELVIVAARPSMGKTALGLSIAEHASIDEGKPIVFFSMEMSRQQIIYRLLCARGRIDSHNLRKGMIRQSDVDSIHAVVHDLQNARMLVDDTPGMTIMELRAKSRRLMVSHKIEMIIVDYLQLMSDPRTARESRQHEIATISRGLKALARELEIPVIALAQLNRNPEGREGNRPRMSDLRESGAIEQDADVIILLHREEYYVRDKLRIMATDGDDDSPIPGAAMTGGKKRSRQQVVQELYDKVKGQAELIVAKQRNGPTGTVVVAFNQGYTRFDNLGHGTDPGYVPRTNDPYMQIPAGIAESAALATGRDEPVFNAEGPGEGDGDAEPF